jgi:hypothetical protein
MKLKLFFTGVLLLLLRMLVELALGRVYREKD